MSTPVCLIQGLWIYERKIMLWCCVCKWLPGLSSSKSESILKAVQGFTPSVAADNKGMSFGSDMTSSSARTASVLHVPAHKNAPHSWDLIMEDIIVIPLTYLCNSSCYLPRPASFGMTQSPAFRVFTWLPTSTTWATPSLPPTAGRSGKMA